MFPWMINPNQLIYKNDNNIMLNFFSHHSLLEGEYKLKDIQVLDEIGRGNSYVYTALIHNKIYALKQIQIKNDHEYQNFLKQITHLKQLSDICQQLIKYQGYFVTILENNQYSRTKYAHIVMQCAEMNLQNLITFRVTQGRLFTKLQLIQILQFLLNAYAHLEKNKIAHCDIKPENILVLNSKTLSMKLCDVGSTKIINSQSIQQATVLGTLPFLAPELLKAKSNKIKSLNIFKSDVFSFGLVLLYMITNKKFTSIQRLEIPQSSYFQVILQWIKEAREIVNYDGCITEILRNSLQFEQHKRPLFNDLKIILQSQTKKKQSYITTKLSSLAQDPTQVQKKSKLFEQNFISFTSITTKKNSAFNKIKNPTNKIGTRTTSIGFRKINKNIQKNVSPFNHHLSPISRITKRQSLCVNTNSHTSPQKMSKDSIKKIIYIKQPDKQIIPFQYINQEQKHFILLTPCTEIKKSQTISIYQPCALSCIYSLAETEINKFYLEYEGYEGEGVEADCPSLKAKKIYANLRKCQLGGGYKNLFKSFCSPQLQSMQLDITGSNIQYNQLLDLVDRLNGRSLKYFGLIWQNNLMSADEHTQLMQKLSKITIKKFIIILNQNFIKYQKQSRWLLPKNCEVLYLEYTNNFIQKIISNLSISISNYQLKQLYLNFCNNNLNKCQINMLFKSVSLIDKLQKLIFNLSWNLIQDISYIIGSIKNLKDVTSLEIKLHHTHIPINQIVQIVHEISLLFEQNLNICKITYDRSMLKQQFKSLIQKAVNGSKILKIDILGYDNKYFMAFIKKINRGGKKNFNSRTIKVEKSTLSTLLRLKSVTDEKQQKKTGNCLSYYSNNRNYDNYVCLTCSDFSQLSKCEYYCKFCIQNCKHKGHSIVKIYQRVRCCCAYSGLCTSDIPNKICAEDLKIRYKKIYKCFKCQKLLCQSCIGKCIESHKDWIQQTKCCVVFQCGSTIC